MIGIDICSISRFSNMKNLDKFLEKYFTIREIEYISNTGYRDETIAGIFSLKEAFVKAIGTGFGTILPIDVEVIHNFSGKPELNVFNTIESKIDEMVVVGYAPEGTTVPEEGTVFEVVEQMPEYPGGMSAMMEFIGKNIKYPVAAQKAKIQGRVVIQFIVDKEGNIICPRVIRGADPLLDAEAIRLTTIMPKWKPGMQRGQAVNVKYTVPIMFRLQEPEKSLAVQNATVTPTK